MVITPKVIAVVNPKGGCGKTTLSTSLAAWLVYEAEVGMIDMDVQQSSAEWLAFRSVHNPQIMLHTLRALNNQSEMLNKFDYLIVDAPAGIQDKTLQKLLRQCDKLLVPLLPSPIDMRAGWQFLQNLFELKKNLKSQTKIGLIANRTRQHTLMYRELTGFIEQFRAPFVGHLRDSVNYMRAMEVGLGVTELPPYQCRVDIEQWQPVIDCVKC